MDNMNTSAKAAKKTTNSSCSNADGSQNKNKSQVEDKSAAAKSAADKSAAKSAAKSTAKSTAETVEDLESAFEDSWNESSAVEDKSAEVIETELDVRIVDKVKSPTVIAKQSKKSTSKSASNSTSESVFVSRSDDVEVSKSDKMSGDSCGNETNKPGSISKLQAFLNNLEQTKPGVSYNMDDKIEFIKKQGEEMIAEYTERGIEVSGVEPGLICKYWEDILYMNTNRNSSYVENIIASVTKHGFESPRPIQSITIGQIAKGNDIIVQAKAGNGKTGGFTIGAALRVNPRLYKTQVLILSPTQILTDQTMEVVKSLTSMTGITVHCYRGGLPHPKDNLTPHIVVGCPGRIKDLIKRERMSLNHIQTVILDEGDELLRQGFREQIKEIVESLNETVQICLFSATLPKGILELCTNFMRNPSYVILPENQVITELVTQWYVKCATVNEKNGSVVDIIENNSKETIIIFFNSCTRLEGISKILSNYGSGKSISHLCVHSKMDSADRAKSIADFSAGKCKVLLASDMASRGLDIPSVTLVVNYDIPFAVETYVHRIGRSGRGDRLGNSVTLIMTEEDRHKITFIVQVHGIPIKVLKSINLESKPCCK